MVWSWRELRRKETDLVIEELAVAEAEVGEAGHAGEDVLQTLAGQLSGRQVQLSDLGVLPLHLPHELVLQTWQMTVTDEQQMTVTGEQQMTVAGDNK